MSWSEYQERTYRTKPQYLAVYIANNLEFNTIVDLGCGSGNETVYLLKKGKQVTSVDAYLNEDYITSRITEEEQNNLHLIKSNIEDITIPKSDVIMSLFTLPFCNPEEFNNIWNKIKDSINPRGYLVANLFGNRSHHASKQIPVFTEEQVKELLKDYTIIKWKEQEYQRELDDTHWHYFDFVAKKK